MESDRLAVLQAPVFRRLVAVGLAGLGGFRGGQGFLDL